MAVIPVGFAQANYRFTGASVPFGAEIVIGYDISGFAGDAAAMGSQLSTDFNAEITAGLLGSGVNMSSILVKFGPNTTGASAVSTGTFIGTGGATASAATSVLATKVTALGGRHGRGRTYWPATPESQSDQGGTIAGGTVTSWQSDLNGWLAANAANDLIQVLLHSDATAPTTITGYVVSARLATQRRRQRR